jgi:ATP-dependent DNA helicase RecQ
MNQQQDLSEKSLKLLQDRFGLRRFRRGQKAVIHRILSGKNAAAVFPTGGGKSLCYQLPSLLLPGTTVVVSPLIALMKDQCDSLIAKGISASRLDSSQNPEAVRKTFSELHSGRTKILYLAPEKFFNERFLASIRQINISLFAIDEAHCISQWGHHFRPDYLKLADLTRELDVERVLALTATATPQVLIDIQKGFRIRKADTIRTPFHRPNLTLKTKFTTKENQYLHLLKQIREQKPGATLVYVTLQRTAEEIADRLSTDGVDAIAYHAGMDNDVRAAIQKQFLESTTKTIVATIAFGMGIDKSNIRNVYHFNAPKSLEGYAQEIGRAGRDGKQAICEMLLTEEDRIVLENFSYGDTPTRSSIKQLVEIIQGQAERFHISHHKLSNETNIRLTVLRTLMTYLELEGWIGSTSPRYETYKLKPSVNSSVILSRYHGENRRQIAELLGCLTKSRIWFMLNVTTAAKKLNLSREQVVNLLNLLQEHDGIEIKASNLMFGYRWKKRFGRISNVIDRLHQKLVDRETDDIERTAMVFRFATSDDCYAKSLSKHFGDELKLGCDNCTACLQTGESPEHSNLRQPRSIGSAATKLLGEIIEQHPDLFHAARDRAKFLCGLSTPQMILKRITNHSAYGVCDSIPFPLVLEQVGGDLSE